jgi:hypothetical protein
MTKHYNSLILLFSKGIRPKPNSTIIAYTGNPSITTEYNIENYACVTCKSSNNLTWNDIPKQNHTEHSARDYKLFSHVPRIQ